MTELCVTCNGSGEGRYDGTRCWSCKGSGEFRIYDEDEPIEEYEND